MSDEDRLQARRDVIAAMAATFGVKKYREGDDGGGAGWTSGIGGTGNGMATLSMVPSDSPAWRRRMEKARREIAEHKKHIDWQETVDRVHRSITVGDISELKQFCEGLFE
jgi:hypothetical protein